MHHAFVDQLRHVSGIVPIRGFTFSAPLGRLGDRRP